MVYCKKCGRFNTGNYCKFCGAKLDNKTNKSKLIIFLTIIFFILVLVILYVLVFKQIKEGTWNSITNNSNINLTNGQIENLSGYCGDFICDVKLNESCLKCPQDCKNCRVNNTMVINKKICGDGICESYEIGNCYYDCVWCGDGYCDYDETCSTCSRDCGKCDKGIYCGDGICNAGECTAGCSKDCRVKDCIDGVCDSRLGENCLTSSSDCPCERGQKCNSSGMCSGPFCGNKICETNENCFCSDCFCDELTKCVEGSCKTYCGNKVCETNENKTTCPYDCGSLPYSNNIDPNSNFPIIYVHGHTANNDYVNVYSINAFKEFDEKLNSEGVIKSMGVILPNTDLSGFSNGEWGKYNQPVSIRTTYYIGTLDSSQSIIGADEDERSIDEYSQRLAKVIDIVLFITGKNKVILITHSMGGLVSRAYIKNNNAANKVDKLIMIGTPNHGIYSLIELLCNNIIYGHQGQQCTDMQYDSGFLSRLNSGDLTPGDTKYYTIAGNITDTDYDGYNDDELIRVNSVELNGATNIVFSGEPISGLDTYHSEMISPTYNMQVYNKVKEILGS